MVVTSEALDLTNGFSSHDETSVEYLLAHTDDLVTLWSSKVKG